MLILSLGILTPGFAFAGNDVTVLLNPYSSIDWDTIDQHVGNTHDHTFNENNPHGRGLQAYLDVESSPGVPAYTIVPMQSYSGEPNPSYMPWGPYCRPVSFWCRAHDIGELPQATLDHAAANAALIVTQIESRAGGKHFTVTPFEGLFVTAVVPAPFPNPNMEVLPDPECSGTGSCAEAYTQLAAVADNVIGVNHPGASNREFPGALRRYASFVEIYSAFYAAADGCRGGHEGNVIFLELWDQETIDGNIFWGVGVNDHLGPDSGDACGNPAGSSPWADTGKTIFLIDAEWGVVAPTKAQYIEALRTGRMIAVKDVGGPESTHRYDYPIVSDFSVNGNDASITHDDPDADIVWITDGLVEHRTAANALTDTLDMGSLPTGSHYVRAEIRADDGDTVFMQPLIVTIVPEPAGILLQLTALLGVAGCRSQRARSGYDQ